jgi:3D (Asp-Asp-Asp) domain-containing protein
MLLRMVFLAAVVAFIPACGRKLPPYEKPIARANTQYVRTTAYTHTEDDHIVHGRKTCVGTPLRCGVVSSAAADWSRWPYGTVFRIVETGEMYEVDDIGWALSGRNTLDLYKPSKSAMNKWGARMVNIEILKWGEDRDSLRVLSKRTKHRHVKRMVVDLEKRIARGATNPAPPAVTLVADATPAAAVAVPMARTAEPVAPPAQQVPRLALIRSAPREGHDAAPRGTRDSR